MRNREMLLKIQEKERQAYYRFYTEKNLPESEIEDFKKIFDKIKQFPAGDDRFRFDDDFLAWKEKNGLKIPTRADYEEK